MPTPDEPVVPRDAIATPHGLPDRELSIAGETSVAAGGRADDAVRATARARSEDALHVTVTDVAVPEVSADRIGAEAPGRTALAEAYGWPCKGVLASGLDADVIVRDPTRGGRHCMADGLDIGGELPWEVRAITAWPRTIVGHGHTADDRGMLSGVAGTRRPRSRPLHATSPVAPTKDPTP